MSETTPEMSPPVPPPLAPPPQLTRPHHDRDMAMVVYILYLAHLVPLVGWVANIVGVVLAYVHRDTAPAWLKTHYTFQIRTFWIGLLYFVIACLLVILVIGIPMLLAVWVWYVVRCALGLSRLLRDEPYPTPESWTL